MEKGEDREVVHLGFAEETLQGNENTETTDGNTATADLLGHRSWRWRDWDGGKIGGTPSWLNPRDVPKIPSLHCDNCDRMLRFVVQLYCPVDGVASAFHRSLYVFACPNCVSSTSWSASSVKVLRCQLPRHNDFFPYQGGTISDDDPQDAQTWHKHESEYWSVALCSVSGLQTENSHAVSNVPPVPYREWELVVEEEPEDDASDGEIDLSDDVNMESKDEQNTETDLNLQISRLGVSNSDHVVSGDSDAINEADDLEQMEQEDLNRIVFGSENKGTSDPITLHFYDRIGRNDGNVRQQCLRYARWSDTEPPLWLSSTNRPPSLPPSCEYCGAPRKFECQIMPQMLHYLLQGISDGIGEQGRGMDKLEKAADTGRVLQAEKGDVTIDWGTIVVYTCTASCWSEKKDRDCFGAYFQEKAWRQPPLE